MNFQPQAQKTAMSDYQNQLRNLQTAGQTMGQQGQILGQFGQAAPQARGTAIAVGNAIATITRATLIVISGQCYERFGILGSATVSAAALCAAAAALIADRRRPIGQ